MGNAKSHPVSVGGRYETAIAFLTDLEEKLEVAQVQLEIYHSLLPRIKESEEVGKKIKLLSKCLMTITEVRARSPCLSFDVLLIVALHSSSKNMRSRSTCYQFNY